MNDKEVGLENLGKLEIVILSLKFKLDKTV